MYVFLRLYLCVIFVELSLPLDRDSALNSAWMNECLGHNRQISIYYLTVFMGEEFKSCLVLWFWLRVSHEVVVKMSAGAGGSKVIHSHVCQFMLVVGRNSQFLHTGAFPWASWVSPCHESSLPQNKQSKRAWQKPQYLLWSIRGSHTLSFLQYPVGYTCQPYSLWEASTQRH